LSSASGATYSFNTAVSITESCSNPKSSFVTAEVLTAVCKRCNAVKRGVKDEGRRLFLRLSLVSWGNSKLSSSVFAASSVLFSVELPTLAAGELEGMKESALSPKSGGAVFNEEQ
jgi:hypothetical protein